MQCKILHFPFPYIEMGFVESNINSYLAQGWRISGIASSDGKVAVFLVK